MRVPETIRKSVVFVMYAESTPGEPDRFGGTAFWVDKESGELENHWFRYLVTAWHVIVKCKEKSCDGKVWLRVNIKNGDRELIESEQDHWYRHPSDTSVDLAVVPAFPESDMDVLPVSMNRALTRDVIEEENVGVGDRIAFPGLFAEHAATTKRDIPIVRRGTIAATNVKVKGSPFGRIDAHLVESRSIGGMSGSPVFADLSGIRGASMEDVTFNFQRFYLLGVMHGHWDYTGGLPDYDDADSSKEDEPRKRVNTGIAIVIPIRKLVEVLDHPKLIKHREEAEAKFLEEASPTEDAADG